MPSRSRISSADVLAALRGVDSATKLVLKETAETVLLKEMNDYGDNALHFAVRANKEYTDDVLKYLLKLTSELRDPGAVVNKKGQSES